MSLHYERKARIPGHPNSGRCAVLTGPDTWCTEAPAFEVDCDRCTCYFELCSEHAMYAASDAAIFQHGDCESRPLSITAMQAG